MNIQPTIHVLRQNQPQAYIDLFTNFLTYLYVSSSTSTSSSKLLLQEYPKALLHLLGHLQVAKSRLMLDVLSRPNTLTCNTTFVEYL